MRTETMNVERLPQHISKVLRTNKVTVEERDGGVLILPIPESSGLFGIAANDKLTLEDFMSYKKHDRMMEE